MRIIQKEKKHGNLGFATIPYSQHMQHAVSMRAFLYEMLKILLQEQDKSKINVCGHSFPFLCFAKTSAFRWKRENFSLFLRGGERGTGNAVFVWAVPFRSDTCPAATSTDRRRREELKGKSRRWNHRVPKLDTFWEACMGGK